MNAPNRTASPLVAPTGAEHRRRPRGSGRAGGWSSKTSWRLTFFVWTTVFVVWALVTALIDYNTLRWIQQLTGTERSTPVTFLALVIALPVLVDAIRNATRNRHRLTARSRSRLGEASWSTAVPAPTPRRSRGSDEQLTWRERAIVEQGQLGYGMVQHHGDLTSVQLQSAWGDTIGSRPVSATEPRPRHGALAPLLFEPGAHVGVAPTLLGLEFVQTAAADNRTDTHFDDGEQVTATDLSSGLSAWGARLVATLHPVERLSRYRNAEVGELRLQNDKLTLSPQNAEPVTIALTQPFRVELHAYPLDERRIELHLRVEPRGHAAYRTGEQLALCVKTELSQLQVHSRIPIGWRDACYVAQDDFTRLWRSLLTASNDETLARSLQLG